MGYHWYVFRYTIFLDYRLFRENRANYDLQEVFAELKELMILRRCS